MFSLPFLFQKGINKTIQIYTQNARDAHIVHTPLALYCKKKQTASHHPLFLRLFSIFHGLAVDYINLTLLRSSYSLAVYGDDILNGCTFFCLD